MFFLHGYIQTLKIFSSKPSPLKHSDSDDQQKISTRAFSLTPHHSSQPASQRGAPNRKGTRRLISTTECCTDTSSGAHTLLKMSWLVSRA